MEERGRKPGKANTFLRHQNTSASINPIECQRCNELQRSESDHTAEPHSTRMTQSSGLNVYTCGFLHKRNIVRMQPTVFGHYPGIIENLASSGNVCCFPNSSQEMTFPTNTLLERGVIKGASERESQRKESVRKRGVSNWEQSLHCSVLYTHRNTHSEKEKGEKKRRNISHTYFYWLLSWMYGAFWSAK